MKSWNDLKWWTSKACADTHAALRWHTYEKHRSWMPHQQDVYRALHCTPLHKVRAVILGQDPYPTKGVATGLAFSIANYIPRNEYPQTLRNIFTELTNDLHVPHPKCGDLGQWADQGVLLWNTALTVEIGKPGSHATLWKDLTEEVVGAVDEHCRGVVFVLWGRYAQRFLPKLLPSIQSKRHSAILSPHPSPLSASRGFFGSRPFSTTNSLLKTPIDWRLT